MKNGDISNNYVLSMSTSITKNLHLVQHLFKTSVSAEKRSRYAHTQLMIARRCT